MHAKFRISSDNYNINVIFFLCFIIIIVVIVAIIDINQSKYFCEA